ncbi:MAG: amino acid ABC transporter permease [Anaerolineae bacterium]|nr:amino acid ABC transporter permease [Anaerolineae bacterium]
MTNSAISMQTDPPEKRRELIDVRGFARRLVRRQSWLIAFLIINILIATSIANNVILSEAWGYIAPGIRISLEITFISFIISVIVGVIVALMRVSKNAFIYNISTFYVELFRGLPLLVIILVFNFVLVPEIVGIIAGTPDTTDASGNMVPGRPTITFLDDTIQRLLGVNPEVIGTTTLRSRDIDEKWRIILAFAVTYGAFMSEVFRAGIESIGRGQMEAARSLGMNYFQAMRYIILPQAVRNILPALGNNFILLLKDTSLASAVAVPEVTYLTRQYSSNRFRYPEGLLVLAFIYANLTVFLALGVNALEHYLQADRREG